jgi:hypothetical protein
MTRELRLQARNNEIGRATFRTIQQRVSADPTEYLKP